MIKLAAELCRRSYGEGYHTLPNTTYVRTINVINVQCHVLTVDGGTVFVFTGSDDTLDWLNNLRFLQIQEASGYVHKGFSHLAFRAAPHLPKVPAYYVGHSLGGALARVLAWRRVRSGTPVKGVYTFGAPRSFDKGNAIQYRNELGRLTYELAHKDDLVPRVPRVNAGLTAGYAHVGCTYSAPGVKVDIDTEPHSFGFEFLFGKLIGQKMSRSKAHSMDNYVEICR